MSSRWANNPEYFDEQVMNFALRGDFGPELQKEAESGDLLPYEIWGRLNDEQLMEATSKADAAWFEQALARAESMRDAIAEDFD